MRDAGLAAPLLLALAASLAAIPARADDKAMAASLFAEGRALLDRNDVQGACDKFSQAEQLAPKGAGILVNLGLCEEQLGRSALAYEHFQRAVRVLGPGDDRRAFAADHARALHDKVGLLTIALAPTAPASAEVRRDGAALPPDSLGQEEALDPGAHTVDVLAAGRADRHYAVTLRAGEPQSVVAEAGEPAAPPVSEPTPVTSVPASAPEAPPVESTSKSRATLTYALGGVAIVGLGMGAYFEASGFSKRSTLDGCKGSCPQNEINDGRQTMLIGDISLGVGLAAAAAAAYFYFTRPASLGAASPSALRVVPQPGGVTAAATWVF